ncbi:putative manganese transporter [soil metagenome]
MLETLAWAVADAFMQVGVYVGLMLVFFGWLQWRTGERVTQVLQRHRHWAPLVGALLGVTPGCAGALLVMPLYARGVVPFGAVVAALVATMGDSSWVLIAFNPQLALGIHGLLLITGILTGYVVHALGISPSVRLRDAGDDTTGSGSCCTTPRSASGRVVGGRGAAPQPAPALRVALPAPAALPVAVPSAATAVGVAPLTFWWLALVGFVVSIPVVFPIGDPAALTVALGGLDPYLLVGNLGTLVAVVVFFQSRARFADDSVDSIAPAQTTMSAVLRNGAKETSFVITWVALTYVVYEVAVGLTGFSAASLAGVGIAGVVVGALVGLVPGCAIQIVFTGLYAAGGLPLPTLLANAVSQDGDALLPLLFTDRRAAAAATAITTVPALVVGLSALALLG